MRRSSKCCLRTLRKGSSICGDAPLWIQMMFFMHLATAVLVWSNFLHGCVPGVCLILIIDLAIHHNWQSTLYACASSEWRNNFQTHLFICFLRCKSWESCSVIGVLPLSYTNFILVSQSCLFWPFKELCVYNTISFVCVCGTRIASTGISYALSLLERKKGLFC